MQQKESNKVKKIIGYVLIAIVFLSSCKKVKKEYFPNGELERAYQYKGEQCDGFYREYHQNGQLAVKAQYSNGKLEGKKRVYYENGTLYWVGAFKNDKEQGEFKEYYENGNLMAKGSFKDGKQTGTEMVYYENGELKSKVEYKDDKPHGKGVYYHPNGKLKMKAIINMGKTNYFKKFDITGKIVKEWRYVKISSKPDTTGDKEKYNFYFNLTGPTIKKDSVVFNFKIYNDENRKAITGWKKVVATRNKGYYSYKPDSSGTYFIKAFAAVGTVKKHKMFSGGHVFSIE